MAIGSRVDVADAAVGGSAGVAASSGVDVAATAVGRSAGGGAGVAVTSGVDVNVTTVGGRVGGGAGVAGDSSGVDADATAVGGTADGGAGTGAATAVASTSSLQSERDLVVVLVWPTAVASMLPSAAPLPSLKLLWVLLPCSNATAPLATAGEEVSLGSTPSGSSAAGSGGGGMEAWFQAAM